MPHLGAETSETRGRTRRGRREGRSRDAHLLEIPLDLLGVDPRIVVHDLGREVHLRARAPDLARSQQPAWENRPPSRAGSICPSRPARRGNMFPETRTTPRDALPWLVTSMTSILDLPEDVTRRYIFSRLAPPDLARCESTCAAWRSAVRADEAATWLASLSFAYDPPEKPPHRLEHAPAPAPVRVAYARRAQELGGWRALAAKRARVERLTSELIRGSGMEDVWRLPTHVSIFSDVWTIARRRFADAESRAWAIAAARSSRLGSELPPDSIDPKDTWHGYVDFKCEDPTPDDTAARERRRWRRRRYEIIASLVAVDAKKGIADALGVHAPPVSSRSPAYQSYVVASVERAAAHISALVWDGWVERDFRGDGVAYVGGVDADSAHSVDPDAVVAALDKLGAEFKRRLDAESRYHFERSVNFTGEVPEDAFAALLDPRVPAPLTGGLRLHKPVGGEYYFMRNSSLASVLNLHHGIPITLCIAYCGIARRGGLRPMFLNAGGHFLCAVMLRDAADGSRTVQVVDPFNPFYGTEVSPQNRFELDRREMLEGETDCPGDVVARLLRNLTNICVARTPLPPGKPRDELETETAARSVAGNLGLVHQTLVTHRALIDAMHGVCEGIGWMASEEEPGFGLYVALGHERQQHRNILAERSEAFEAGVYPWWRDA